MVKNVWVLTMSLLIIIKDGEKLQFDILGRGHKIMKKVNDFNKM